jgi:hypothetical protein
MTGAFTAVNVTVRKPDDLKKGRRDVRDSDF